MCTWSSSQIFVRLAAASEAGLSQVHNDSGRASHDLHQTGQRPAPLALTGGTFYLDGVLSNVDSLAVCVRYPTCFNCIQLSNISNKTVSLTVILLQSQMFVTCENVGGSRGTFFFFPTTGRRRKDAFDSL